MNRADRIFEKIVNSPAFLPLLFLSYDFTLLCIGGRSFSTSIRYHIKQLRGTENGIEDQSVYNCAYTGDSK